jgi:hypothetical protein
MGVDDRFHHHQHSRDYSDFVSAHVRDFLIPYQGVEVDYRYQIQAILDATLVSY